MNGSALHLFSSHVPVVGSVFVLALLVAAVRTRERVLWQTTIVASICVAIAASISMTSGPMASEHVRPWLDPEGIERIRLHEVAGQLATAALALVAILGLQAWLVLGRHGPEARWITPALLATAMLAVAASGWAGALGGKIRHIELREPRPHELPREEAADQGARSIESPLDSTVTNGAGS